MSVFGEESDDDDAEEMPPEARMRMKNIGRLVYLFVIFKSQFNVILIHFLCRDTPTSAGPNSVRLLLVNRKQDINSLYAYKYSVW